MSDHRTQSLIMFLGLQTILIAEGKTNFFRVTLYSYDEQMYSRNDIARRTNGEALFTNALQTNRVKVYICESLLRASAEPMRVRSVPVARDLSFQSRDKKTLTCVCMRRPFK